MGCHCGRADELPVSSFDFGNTVTFSGRIFASKQKRREQTKRDARSRMSALARKKGRGGLIARIGAAIDFVASITVNRFVGDDCFRVVIEAASAVIVWLAFCATFEDYCSGAASV